MPRPLRLQDAGYIHHVISRGNDGQTLFKSTEDFQEYISLLERTRRNYPLKIYNYCLMDNHVHLLVEPQKEGSLSKVMQIVSKEYAKYFNKKYNRRGHVFEGRFKSFIVQQERYFFTCSRYIDLNPVKAGLTTDPTQHKWTGYAQLAGGGKSILKLDTHELYSNLGTQAREREIAYRALVLNYQGEEVDLMEHRGSIIGDKEFKKRIRGKG